jgi:hypothetical protein
MHHIHSSRLLKIALWVDALISSASGVLQVAAPDRLNALLDLPHSLLLGTGKFYLAYAVALALLAMRRRLWAPLVLLIAVGNLGWGLAATTVLLVGAITPNALGVGFVLMQAAAVTAFAAAQWLGLRLSTADPGLSSTGNATIGRA